MTVGAKEVRATITEGDFEHRTLFLGIDAGRDFNAGDLMPVARLDQIIAALTMVRDKAQELGLLTPRKLPEPLYLDKSSAAL